MNSWRPVCFTAVCATTVLVLCLLTTACIPVSTSSDRRALITGTVTYRERMLVPPEAVVTVSLAADSSAGGAAETVAETRFLARGGPPYAFALGYDPGELDRQRGYSLRASIRMQQTLLFAGSTNRPALENASGVEILLTRAATGVGQEN